jgi:hypothetical protein
MCIKQETLTLLISIQQMASMKISRLIKNNLFLYCIIFISINFLGGMPCAPDPNSYTEYDPSHGVIKDLQGNYVPQAKVIQTLKFPNRKNITIYDSTTTTDDGSYILSNGVPNHYHSKDGGMACAINKVYDKMSTFYLVVVHSSYDTTVALFMDDPSTPANSASNYGVDTVFTGAGTVYGPVGSLRQMPTIVMKPKTY